MIYSKLTRGIVIEVTPTYLGNQSIPAESHFVWAYNIRIENTGAETVQLISRFWRITNAFGIVQEVKGLGVVGEQPVLAPGESYEYTSGATLKTENGIMSGNYQMMAEGMELFEAEIPAFSLDMPLQKVVLN